MYTVYHCCVFLKHKHNTDGWMDGSMDRSIGRQMKIEIQMEIEIEIDGWRDREIDRKLYIYRIYHLVTLRLLLARLA